MEANDPKSRSKSKREARAKREFTFPPISDQSHPPEALNNRELPPLSTTDAAEDEDDVQVEVFSCPVEHDGTSVYVKGWRAENNDKCPIVFIHDLGEHVGLYRQVGRHFAEEGYSFYGFDLRGHGRTGRALGHIGHFDALVKDLLQVVAWVKHRSHHTPVIVGQGLGAIIALFFQAKFPQFLRGMVLLTPTWHHSDYMSLPKRLLIQTLAELFPTMRLPRRLTPRYLLAKTDAFKRELQPLSSGTFGRRKYGITANFAREVLDALATADSKFQNVDCPTLLVVPSEADDADMPNFEAILTQHKFKDRISVFRAPEAERQMLAASDAHCAEAVFQKLRLWLDEELPKHKHEKSIKLDRRLFDGMPLA